MSIATDVGSLLIAAAALGFTARGEIRKRMRGREPEKEKKVSEAVRISIGGVPLPGGIETTHILFAGATGTGKSQTMSPLAAAARARGDRAVVVDPGGELMARQWREGDVVLAPLDARSADWSPFAEMSGPQDADRIAKSMLPDADGMGDAAQWQLYSQGLVAAVLQRLWENGAATNGELVHTLTVMPAKEIEKIIEGLPAATLMDVGAAKMLSSVRGIIGSYLPSYRFLSSAAGTQGWSIREWVETGKGWLWLPYRADHASSMRPLLACWIGELVSAMLSLRPNRDRRIWLLLDELAALGRVQSLSDALAQGRKFGLCCCGGLQTLSQLRTHYGQHGAQTLLSCFRSQLILAAGDPETADWCSRALGERQLRRRNQTVGESVSSSEQIAIERIVLPSEIQKLPNLAGYLNLAGDYPVARVQIPLAPDSKEVCAPFIPRSSTIPPAPPASGAPAAP